MKFKFKIIPFIISLLIVVGVTFGICWYSYHDYEGNKIKFLDNYFHVDDYENQKADSLISNAVKMQSTKYQKANEKVKFLNSSDFTEISSEVDESAPYYLNGTAHIPNFFDIDVYVVATETKGDWTYNYHFYIYNINYRNSDFDPTNLQLLLVDGTGNATEEEKEKDDYKESGFDLINSAYDALFDENSSNNPSITDGAFYKYIYTGENAQKSEYKIYDTGFTNAEAHEDGTEHLVFRMVPKTDNNHNSLYESSSITSGDVSFCLFYNNGTSDSYKIINGTISDITDVTELDYTDGCASNPVIAPEYGTVILGKIFLHGGIAFILSGIVAFLFYMIWMDDTSEQTKKNKKFKK